MAAERLLVVHFESVTNRKHADLVIHALARQPVAIGMRPDDGHAVLLGVADVLDDDGDAVVPHAQHLVVGAADEAAGVVDEGEAVDGAHVGVVGLHGVVGVAHVVLEDGLVGAGGEELVGVGGVEAHAVGDGARVERRHDAPRLRVPQQDAAVVAGGEERVPIVRRERHVAHALRVPAVAPDAAPLLPHIPDLRLPL